MVGVARASDLTDFFLTDFGVLSGVEATSDFEDFLDALAGLLALAGVMEGC